MEMGAGWIRDTDLGLNLMLETELELKIAADPH